ncbi:MAG: efflux RND transporter periplasmic adaptor subunit, partial [Segetibacter sp.]
MKRFISFGVLVLTLVMLYSSCNGENEHSHEEGSIYTCSMHPQIIRNEPGDCPICGMALVKKEQNTNAATKNDSLKTSAGPTDEIIVASLPLTTLEQSEEGTEINALGSVQHDNRHIYTLPSRMSGRIEKLYVRYRYQYIGKGQKVFEIYSPELLTAQQNLIFLYKSDPSNHSLISAARQRLLLLGMNEQQLAQLSRTGKPIYSVTIYSPTSGYVTEAGFNSKMDTDASGSSQAANGNAMSIAAPTTTTELPV